MKKSGWIKAATEDRLTVILDGGLEACSGCGQAVSGESSCPGCAVSGQAPCIEIRRRAGDGLSVGDRIELIEGNASIAVQALVSLGIPLGVGFAAFFGLRAFMPSVHPGFCLLVAFALTGLTGGLLQKLAGKRLGATRYVKLPLDKSRDL